MCLRLHSSLSESIPPSRGCCWRAPGRIQPHGVRPCARGRSHRCPDRQVWGGRNSREEGEPSKHTRSEWMWLYVYVVVCFTDTFLFYLLCGFVCSWMFLWWTNGTGKDGTFFNSVALCTKTKTFWFWFWFQEQNVRSRDSPSALQGVGQLHQPSSLRLLCSPQTQDAHLVVAGLHIGLPHLQWLLQKRRIIVSGCNFSKFIPPTPRHAVTTLTLTSHPFAHEHINALH